MTYLAHCFPISLSLSPLQRVLLYSHLHLAPTCTLHTLNHTQPLPTTANHHPHSLTTNHMMPLATVSHPLHHFSPCPIFSPFHIFVFTPHLTTFFFFDNYNVCIQIVVILCCCFSMVLQGGWIISEEVLHHLV
jgi:hypothetical protein